MAPYRIGGLDILTGTINAERFRTNTCSHADIFFMECLKEAQNNAKSHTASITTAWLPRSRVRALNDLPAVQIFHQLKTFATSSN